MEAIKILSVVEEEKIHDLKRRELIKYVLKLRKFVVKQNEKIAYQKNKINHLKEKLKELSVDGNAKKDKKSEESLDEENDEKEKETREKDSLPECEEAADNFLDDIKSAAEAQSLKNGFIYEPTSGLYYDTATGYYYNAEYGLYYDGSTGKYYTYDQSTKEFTYHSTVATAAASEIDDPTERIPKKGKKRKIRSKEAKSPEDLEDGEISSDDSYVECSTDDEHIFEDISKHYPPSLRVIVQQSSLDKLKVGTLFLVTCKGGSLGREGGHDVVIPDINVSKCHLKFTYDETEACYKCQDQGSRNGTLLNGSRMSESLVESPPVSLPHGSVIQISETRLLCHVHPGTATCGYCEPGLLMQTESKQNASSNKETGNESSHKSQLKKLQRKYGLEKEKYADAKKNPAYNDRAEHRRETVGSSNANEKTATASVNESIPATNKGFKMLSKLGWKTGQALGKAADAIVEPIQVQGNAGTQGLGSGGAGITVGAANVGGLDRKNEIKTMIWKKTQQRYSESKQKAVNIFGESDEEDGGE